MGGGSSKKGYRMPHAPMENADVARIINSDEVQSVLKPKLDAPRRIGMKVNALKNKAFMEKLNPGATQKRAMRKRACEPKTKECELVQKQKKARLADTKKYKNKDEDTFYKKMMKAYETKAAENDAAGEEEE